ncbi:hypothetical protein AJ85_19120 [Alkalihalobacillus alcalophilus ATCC 27647 = CGMCC 1.3604]|uniref:YdhG-like domain-containing protein n=1 Tax=Alkalihalobacillus alcalophilus ATCC 27647 = CGMCC 1.3604 TaxID=1218173 RepID=A0A094XJL6_ALKAL|nr:DUF1801 domain-containing protein [Alkalihalobacillus alcalophilus]KGA98965.1 hypothetical protein BALCAV_0201580 [Alkalihalobacillus alcalophilus ATCC 27647 = CGMCC 1.3604]MED1562004.1 DUF1801 domain-containing protein [Alkalihalobacillus alcalophilus]THG89223.1 hypothetical protein AJ85_19120 [Alkalihalobacillus alcalophilus ATCC 27647 = CGMCC 1.3604]
MNTRENVKVTELIEELPEHTQEITLSLRKIIWEASPELVEEVKWSKPSYAQGGLVCYLAPAKNHVNLGLYQGSKLNDKEGVLQGTGKDMRHIQVKKVEDIRADLYNSLIQEAIELNK